MASSYGVGPHLRLAAVDLRDTVLAAAICRGVLATALTELFDLVRELALGWLLAPIRK